MTALRVVDGGKHTTLTDDVARRLRGQLAERNIHNKDLAKMTGKSEMYIGRRVRGLVALSTDDLADIEAATGISAGYLVTGQKMTPQPGGPGGNMHTKDYKSPGSHLRLVA